MASCIKPITVKHKDAVHRVPCGNCAFCLKSKRQQWIFRLHQEARTQENPAWFLTLTYDEKHVPRKKGVKTLYFRHVQLFFKRLRKAKYVIKYVAVGEYGSETQRPHYHVIAWTNAPTEAIEKAWHYGAVHFGSLTPASIAYTLKYIVQPKHGDNETKQKTRAQFSKGLGASYLTAAVHEYHSGDEEHPIFESRYGQSIVALPRYYRNKIFTKYQLGINRSIQYWRSIKDRRAEIRRLRQFSDKPIEYLKQRQVQAAKNVVTKVSFNQKL